MSVVFTLIGYLGFVSCLVWSLIEFILYLVKDKEYNFWSLYLLPVFLVLMIIAFIKTVNNQKEDGLFKFSKPSKFEQRLKEIEELKSKTK